MTAAIERFGARNEFIVGLRLGPVSGVATFSIDAIRVAGNNVSAEQNFEVDFTVNGASRTLKFTFADEFLETLSITGRPKRYAGAPL